MKKYRVALLVDYLFTDYTNELIEGITTACHELDMELLVFPIGTLNNEVSKFDYQLLAITALVNSRNIMGIIVASGTQIHHISKKDFFSYIKSYKPLPIVSISIPFQGIPSVIVEPSAAYRTLIEKLLKEQKCKKIGIMGVDSTSIEVRNRLNIIKQVLKENNIPEKDIYIWKSKFEYPVVMKCLEDYFDKYHCFEFDAIVAFNDEMAFACMDFCNHINLRVPEDVVVVGFDDLDKSQFSNPSLTSINQQIPKQGYEAVKTLRQLLEGNQVEEIIKVPSKLILRNSTMRYPYSKDTENEFTQIDFELNYDFMKNYASEWYLKKSQMLQLTRFYIEMHYDMSMNDLRNRIVKDLVSFQINAAAIVIYENPIEMTTPFDYFNLPHKASVFVAYDTIYGYLLDPNSDQLKFDPNDSFLPQELIKIDSNGIFLFPLYHNELQFGYMVFRRGDYDNVIYDLLSKIISYIISSVYSYSLVNNEQSKIRRQYNRLDVIASTDDLTGLYNRRGLYDYGIETLNFSKAMGQGGIVVYCDLDGLKKINDTFGHEAGDKAIVAESIILKGNFRSDDVIARLGGDEFVVICKGLTIEAFLRIKKQINLDCEKWSKTSSAPFELSASMGYVTYPSENGGFKLAALLAEADASLYKEKRLKKSLRKD